ncbi:RNA 2',3'-cyclic phosphodiesterase [Ectothiorhodospira mobilis]|uniref:RNA 2',3'-cyclic phosphodiesterase n=1 Tax=Ectothiorhodospira mobilis TaxID=195064 RepID=UPI001904C4A6|nr:RNA 2',3'-cyclic phosphodiesterase [Ectothiorhodospira mobilis]
MAGDASRPPGDSAPSTGGRGRGVFFALWPDDALRREILARTPERGVHGGRPVPAANLHLTLVFVGRVDGTQLRCLETSARRVVFTPFSFQLRALGMFPGPRVLWLGAAEPAQPLARLAGALAGVLATDCGHRPETRPYRPHVTLARRLRHPVPPTPVAPVTWRVQRFCLVESVDTPAGPRYRPLAWYPAQGADL